MSERVRTRFAPSPSGFLHVGGARTALFNYLYAKACGGDFVLRIEDTDQERSTPESERIILDSLKWLGIYGDEGVEEGGNYGPYRQSERLDIYKTYTEKLQKSGHIYPCFCTNEELEAKQQRSKTMGLPHVYDGKCRNLSEEEVQQKIAADEKYAMRFKVDPEEIIVDDVVQGKVKFDAKLIGDFIVVKSDGFPSYNYAVVVDDHEMMISHIIRGVGHLSNTPRQILIHRALEIPLPTYAHISEIVGTDKKKLSKRRGATSVLLFRDMGYISEAFVNYMALLGWYPEDAVEFLPDGKLKEKFDIARCSKSPAMFDFFLTEKAGETEDFDPASLSYDELQKFINPKSKLKWLNNKYIKHIPEEELFTLARPFLEKDPEIQTMLQSDEPRIRKGLDSMRDYLDNLEGTIPYLKELFRSDILIESEEAREELAAEPGKAAAAKFAELLESEKPVAPDDFSALMKQAGKETGAKGRGLFMPIRIASTGSRQGLELPILFTILGASSVAKRMKSTLDSV